jgi:hypothetical protein
MNPIWPAILAAVVLIGLWVTKGLYKLAQDHPDDLLESLIIPTLIGRGIHKLSKSLAVGMCLGTILQALLLTENTEASLKGLKETCIIALATVSIAVGLSIIRGTAGRYINWLDKIAKENKETKTRP